MNEALKAAVMNDPYSPGESDITATQLCKEPHEIKLMLEHKNDIVKKPEKRIWSLYGQIVHGILERASESVPGCIIEQRFYAEINGTKIGGQVDFFDRNGVLYDYKFTSVYSYKFPKKEHKLQLNILAWLLAKNGIAVSKLVNVYLFRDWRESESLKEDWYPEKQYAEIEQPQMKISLVEKYVSDFIEAVNDSTTPCKETWREKKCKQYCDVAQWCDKGRRILGIA